MSDSLVKNQSFLSLNIDEVLIIVCIAFEPLIRGLTQGATFRKILSNVDLNVLRLLLQKRNGTRVPVKCYCPTFYRIAELLRKPLNMIKTALDNNKVHKGQAINRILKWEKYL